MVLGLSGECVIVGGDFPMLNVRSLYLVISLGIGLMTTYFSIFLCRGTTLCSGRGKIGGMQRSRMVG